CRATGRRVGWARTRAGGARAGPPPPQVQHSPADTVGQARKRLVAVPGMAPNQIVRPGVLGVRCNGLLGRSDQTQAGQVLDVGRKKKRASVDHQHPEADILSPAVEFVGDVAAEHARADDHDIKGITAIVADLVPSAARPTAEKLMGERGLLDIDECVRIRIKTRQHLSLLCRYGFSLAAGGRPEPFGSACLHRCSCGCTQIHGSRDAFDLGAERFMLAARYLPGAAITEYISISLWIV